MRSEVTMADNYRKDAAFGSIDSSKVHLRYAQVAVINIEEQRDIAECDPSSKSSAGQKSRVEFGWSARQSDLFAKLP